MEGLSDSPDVHIDACYTGEEDTGLALDGLGAVEDGDYDLWPEEGSRLLKGDELGWLGQLSMPPPEVLPPPPALSIQEQAYGRPGMYPAALQQAMEFSRLIELTLLSLALQTEILNPAMDSYESNYNQPVAAV